MTTGFSSLTKADAQRQIRKMKAFKKTLRTKQAARTFLAKHGFITNDGKLAPRYR